MNKGLVIVLLILGFALFTFMGCHVMLINNTKEKKDKKDIKDINKYVISGTIYMACITICLLATVLKFL